MKRSNRLLRPLGGLTGMAIALAGGFGVAVGTYSLPDPQNLRAEADAYARADQRAMAVWKYDDEAGHHELRIEATRGPSAEARAAASLDDMETHRAHDENAYFQAQLTSCPPDVEEWECGWRHWRATVPLDAIEFDPAMGGAHFAGSAACDTQSECEPATSCSFDVTWTADGLPAHFEQRQAEAHLGSQGFNEKAEGFAEISRVAPASISTSCVGSTESAPGYLSVGLRRYIVGRGGVSWAPPPEDEGGE